MTSRRRTPPVAASARAALDALRARSTWLERPLARRPRRSSGSAIYLAALVIFGAFWRCAGVNPFAMYHAMWDSTFDRTPTAVGQMLVKAAPFILAALAVAVPARAGLVNVGGEGQLVIGAIAAGGVALALGDARARAAPRWC